jgi:hypothetical protein
MDPATVAQAIAQIIAKINELNERSAARAWQSDVTSKLDLVIVQNGQIIALLHDLFVFVPEQLERFFNEEAVIRSRALTRQFDVYMAASPPNIRGIREMRDESERASFELLERGPAIYQAANGAALFVLVVYKVTRVDRRERQAFIDQTIARMTEWLSDGDGMFGAALKKQEKIISDNRPVLSQVPRGRVELYRLESRVEIGGNPDFPRTMPCTVFLHTNIQIDDVNLTRSPLDPEVTSDCGELSLENGVVTEKISAMRAHIDSLLDTIRKAEDRKARLEGHIAALKSMVDHLQHA